MALPKDSSNKESMSRKLGNKIERAGEKVAEKAPKTGKAIRDFGDRVEHMSDDDKKVKRS
jgi:hypothetical protein